MQMPSLSPTMSQGNISSWKKKEGESFGPGDVLAEIETDKATMEWEAQDEGVLAKILMGDGAKDIAVGTPVAVIVEDAKDVEAFSDYKSGSGGSGGQAEQKPQQESQPSPSDGGEQAESSGGGGGGGGGGNWPSHSVLGLPALSPTMSQGNIAAWKKKEGEQVSPGDSIAEIETDKATMDWEAQEDGFIAKILAGDGSKDIAVGTPVLVFVEDEGDVAAFKDFTAEDAKGGGAPKAAPKKEESKQAAPEAKPAPKQEAPKEQPQQAALRPSKPSGGRVVASPYARKLAHEAGVDISQAQATGPGGRIVAADVQKLISSGGGKGAQPSAGAPPQGEDGEFWTDIPNTQIRRVTAKRLLEAKQTIPHYYLTVDCRVDNLMKLRAQLNEALASRDGGKLSVNDFVVKASALALRKVPGVNSSWMGDFIRQYHNVDISVAVQTPQGLMVPVLRDADGKGLSDISAGVKALAGKAKEGKLSGDDMSGGTFTISNLGMFKVDQFAAIVNPPQAAILAIGGASKRVVMTPAGQFEEASMMSTTLSCDHRVVDGAMGAQWLQAFRGYIEDPVSMML